MAELISLRIDPASLASVTDRVAKDILRDGQSAVAVTTRDLEKRFEAAIQSAVPGRLYRAWGSKVFGGNGAVFVKGGPRSQGAMEFWTQPGTVRAQRGQYLAVPLPAAGSRGRGRDLTPAAFEARTGIKLRFVARPGRSPLLVADNSVLSGKRQVARLNTPRRIAAGRGSATVPVFVLIPSQKFGNAVALQPIVDQSAAKLASEFFAAADAARGSLGAA